ncbi:hypothetical protein [Ottowia sp.]|uniref:hypothetical protein n=1 Tax=Ottowia sp. TaxID=1898956 RepID=UPI002CFF22CC|nr:hypothetical protein [Ottowia sp.]HOB65901.1 hypothetical protein [Ottowia sp.]HPZ56884.1 hypothetical protein [Ottowia sp.]HQD47756.1 hypothetical protein [Ottowia sp.]
MKADGDDKRPRTSPLARWAGALIALALGGLGAYTLMVERYVGPPSRYVNGPRSPAVIEGPPALWYGLALIAFGLTGLFVFARSPRAAATWVAMCVLAGIALMLLPAWLA